MSSGEINANNVNQLDAVYLELQPLLLQIVVVFDSNTSSNVVCSESYADFVPLVKELEQYADYSGVIRNEVLHISEINSRNIDLIAREIISLAVNYSGSATKVDIDIYVPTSLSGSLNVTLLKWKFDVKNELNESEYGKYFPDKVSCQTNRKISIRKVKEISFVESDSSSNFPLYAPTSLDARTAAVLTEYTYYLTRLDEQNEQASSKKIISKIAQNITPVHTVVSLTRRGSINSRAKDTVKEVSGLEIIPRRWLQIKSYRETFTESKSFETGHISNNKDIDILKKSLLEWDAIRADGEGWVGMSPFSKEWEGSLSQRLYEKIKSDKDKRFSITGNKGFLNRWLFFSGNPGLHSVIFVNESKREIMYCVAGSNFGLDMFWNGDWTTTNITQALTGLSPQYQQSVTNALILDRAVDELQAQFNKEKKGPIKLIFIGHSLGGGLASNNAIMTKQRHAVTFNAAGLNWARVNVGALIHNRNLFTDPTRGRSRVHAFVIKGEILDTIQILLNSGSELTFSILGLTAKLDIRAYSSENTRVDISAPKKETSKLKKHSMTNFLSEETKILEIKV